MDFEAHWEKIYRSKSPRETSWFQPHLQTSIEWITQAVPDRSASVIDIGGGESTLVDDLLASGYRNVTVLDIAAAAIEKSRKRVAAAGEGVGWIVGDVTGVSLPSHGYDLWHDRALFHFLTESERRSAYLSQINLALKPGGHLVMATFGPEGPERCSGLVTRRYDANSLRLELGPGFTLVNSRLVDHETPFGTNQQFLYCHFTLGSARESN